MKLAYPILLITCVFFLISPNTYTATYSFSTENGMHSKILNRYQDSTIVEQQFVGKIMNIDFRQKVILKVKYTGYKIIMEQIEGDFVHYRSVWSLTPQKNDTNMTIDTEFKVSFFKNLFVSKASLERKYRIFLENMSQQINSGLYEHCTQKN